MQICNIKSHIYCSAKNKSNVNLIFSTVCELINTKLNNHAIDVKLEIDKEKFSLQTVNFENNLFDIPKDFTEIHIIGA